MYLKYRSSLFLFGFIQLCTCALYYVDSDYKGEYFVAKYLEPDKNAPTKKHLQHYLKKLQKTVYFFFNFRNRTDGNACLGGFYVKALLKRTIRDYGHKLNKKIKKRMKKTIYYGEDIISHCTYPIKIQTADASRKKFNKIIELFNNDEPQVYSIENFNKNKLRPWLQSNISLNFLGKHLDKANITKERFIKIVHFEKNSYLTAPESDLCLSRIRNNPEPIHFSELNKCVEDRRCNRIMHKSPSVAYFLSHRLFYLMLLRHRKRCFINTIKLDDHHRDVLCAAMYREIIYIARKGYFFRDLFLEHIALCGMLGYEEFHRVPWFNKMASWQDKFGCVRENQNTHINRTRLAKEYDENTNAKRQTIPPGRFHNSCHIHTMSLYAVAMAHAVRYAAFVTTQAQSDGITKVGVEK